MKILIIGGTIFLGRHLIESALARGHEVTVFNRGRHNSDLYPQIEKLRGDRERDLSALQGREWDAIIDTCGYLPGVVQKSAEFLRDRVAHYTFISSCSVYGDYDPHGSDENSPVAEITGEQLAEAEKTDPGERATAASYGAAYGGLKRLCERAAEAALPNRVLNVRAGLIAGQYDSVGRFTYWVRRIAEGGIVLAPGKPSRRVRIIDARDLADWIIGMAEARKSGIYNATGAEDGATFGSMLEEIRQVSQSDAEFVWANEEFLETQKVAAWSELPLWLPEKYNGIFEIRNDWAIAAGLKFRLLAETIRDTLRDLAGQTQIPGTGLTPGREKELLNLLRQ